MAESQQARIENPTVDKIRRVMNRMVKHGQRYGLISHSDEANPMKFGRVKTQSDYEARIIAPQQGFHILMSLQ